MENNIWESLKFRGEIIDTYEVSSRGQFRNKKVNRILRGTVKPDGYQRVEIVINGKRQSIYRHRGVAETFLENPENLPIVNHKDLNKSNNRVENLEWVTSAENNKHAIRNGRKIFSRAVNQLDKITNEIIQTFPSIARAAKEIAGNKHCISNCANGKIKTSAGFKWELVVGKEKLPEDVQFVFYKGYNIYPTGKIGNKNFILKPRIHGGYEMVALSINGKQKDYSVHRLVAECFIPNSNPEKNKVNHKDGNKLNNDSKNLEWVTHQENMIHASSVLGKGLKAVSQYDLDGNFMRSYGSITEATKMMGKTNPSFISKICIWNAKNEKPKIAYGYIWKFGIIDHEFIPS